MSEILKPEKKKRKVSLLDNLVGILIVGYFLIVGGQALGDYVIEPGLAAVLAALIPGLTDGAAWVTATLYVGFLGIWAVTLLVMFLTSRNRPMLKALGTKTKGNTLKMFAVGLGIGLGMNLLCAFIAMANGDIRLTFSSFRPISFLVIFVAVFVQSSAEELLCRVFVYHRLMRRYGKPVLAVLVNSVFFALNHIFNDGISVLAMLNIFLYGLLFSAMVVYMDSPWAAMAAHASWNFCQNILQGSLGFLGGLQVLFTDDLTQTVRGLGGSFHTQVSQDQAFLQLVVKIIVQLAETRKYIAQRVAQGISGLGQTSLNFIKKSHNFSFEMKNYKLYITNFCSHL